MIVEDTGWDCPVDHVLLQVTAAAKPRDEGKFYRCWLRDLPPLWNSPDDVIVNFVTMPMKIGHSALVGRVF